jgi:hypothetical protein
MHDADGWVTILEAARRLRLSPATVRRRIKLGLLEGELHHGRRGPEYRVRVPSEPTVDSVMEASDATQPTPDLTQTVAELLRLVERQQAELRDVHFELTASTASSTEWRTRAELLDRRVAELKAELERARRPWWRTLLG